MSKTAQMIAKIIRVACYVRVSTEEQKKHGYSIATQIAQLKEYVEQHDDMMLVDFYVDEGVSAVKVKKRLELQRLLNDVKDGKIDLILFTKLDRWGRDVKIYHQIQDELDKYGVAWESIFESYENRSASGKFKINVMMAVSQQMRDTTSENITNVFREKIKNGEAVTGAQPCGWMVKEIDGKKRVVRNPDEEETLRAMLKYYRTHQSVRKTIIYAQDNFEHHPNYNSFTKILSNTYLYGHFRGFDDYCEGYMTKTEFDEVQHFKKNNIRHRETDHIYIFSQLLKCPVCGGNLTGYVSWTTHADGKRKANLGYRCETHWFRTRTKKCTFKPSKSQLKLEKIVLDNLMPMLEQYIINCESSQKKVVKKADVNKVKAEMERLNNMYLKGRISEDDYDKKYVELNNKLMQNQATETHLDVSEELKALQGINLHELYKTFSESEKQAFMRGIIREIHIDEDYNIKNIIFL